MNFIALTIIFILQFLLTTYVASKSKQINDPAYISEYFHLISTIDKPLDLQKYYGMQQPSIEFYPGTMNIILSVPHDGNLRSNLPKRPKAACRKSKSASKKCYVFS